MRVAALLAACLAAACSSQPETLPNPYVQLGQAPIRTIGLAAGSSPFARAVGAALTARGFALTEIPDAAARAAGGAGPYVSYPALASLAAEGVDAVLAVHASRGGTGPLETVDDFAFLDRAAAASATVTATADGAVLAAADWRPRLGVHVGPTPTRSASGPILGTELLAPPTEQLADVLAAQILR
jgi:hypothetical protein